MMPKWTKAQERAIYEPSGEGNILVSAAAGSGKTAVLVERIVNMVANGTPIDSLLVVTFTKAAAAEMKERIISRLNDQYRLSCESGSAETAKYLKKQIHMTASADINTIDAFCLNAVKNNFHVLGIDPNFGIMDENEGKMMKEDVLSELFESLYATDNSAERGLFEYLVRIFASNRNDNGLMSVILKVHSFIQPFADPFAWLDEKAAMYSEDVTKSGWMKQFLLPLRDETAVRAGEQFEKLRDEMLSEAEKYYGKSLGGSSFSDIPEAAGFWGSLWEKLNNCIAAAKMLAKCESWEDFVEYNKVCISDESYLGTKRNKYSKKCHAEKDFWNGYLDRCHSVRTYLKNRSKIFPSTDGEAYNKYAHGKELKKMIDGIVWLTELFDAKLSEQKDKKNKKSFYDIEHLTYRLFSENENIRAEYAERYAEILIDEFQDTNGLQDAIFTLISRNNQNIFMVGDLKQSIYRFRGGNPMIFKQKSRSYASGSGGKLIMLSQNFRSRTQVLDSVNEIFSVMMSDEVGDVCYEGDEMLCRDADKDVYSDGENLLSLCNAETGYLSHFCRIAVIGDETDEEITTAKAEAYVIAQKIRALSDGHFKIHRGGGRYTDIEYRDIVILTKSSKNEGAALHDALEKTGIPAFVQKEEYFERREIKLMLSLLSLINNHLQDIPLAAVMRSPIGGFTETEMAAVKLADKKDRKGSLYSSLTGYKAEYDISAMTDEQKKRLEGKCRRFTENLERWRSYIKRKPIAALIWTLYEETNFYDFMGALEGGEEAQANLNLLYERAKHYEETGFRGVFNFIRYIEQMEKRKDDIAGAQLINESHNVVRIMTVHKSKGLEFPVVFLAGTGKSITYTHSGEENRVLLNRELGIAADYYNYDEMYTNKLDYTDYIRAANRSEHLSEELRLLYVAATRAREKLYVTASYSFKSREKYERKLSEWNKLLTAPLPADIGRDAKKIADWIWPVAQREGTKWNLEDIVAGSVEFETHEAEETEVKIENPDEIRTIVKKMLEYDYKYPKSGAIPSKTSVTAIKEMADEENIRADHNDTEPIYMMSKPAFMRGEKKGARIGTAHHQVMAYINLETLKSLSEDDYDAFVRTETERIAASGQIESEIAEDESVREMICSNVCGFFRSDMGKAVLNARKVYRETPFEIEISALEYDSSLGEKYMDEKIIVQGIIDLFYENSIGDIVLVDYKTDRCKTKDEQLAVAEKYRRQLELYERAMEKILKRKVKNKYLYLFSAQSVVEL